MRAQVDFLPEQIGHWKQQRRAGELKAEADRRSVHSEQAEIMQIRTAISRSKMEVVVPMVQGHPEKAATYFAKDIL